MWKNIVKGMKEGKPEGIEGKASHPDPEHP